MGNTQVSGEADPESPQAGASRAARRKARTRQALLEAGRTLLARKGTADFSVQEVTDEADVGLGSFYNHFDDKQQLIHAAIDDVLDEHGRMLDAWTAELADPARVLALVVRTTARLAATRHELARVLIRDALGHLFAERGFSPLLQRHIQRGMTAGRFTLATPDVGLAMVGGSLLALLHRQLQESDEPDSAAYDELAEHLLLGFGIPSAEARRIARAPLPAPPECAGTPAPPPA